MSDLVRRVGSAARCATVHILLDSALFHWLIRIHSVCGPVRMASSTPGHRPRQRQAKSSYVDTCYVPLNMRISLLCSPVPLRIMAALALRSERINHRLVSESTSTEMGYWRSRHNRRRTALLQ